MTKAEQLEFWAAILEKPYRDANGDMHPPVEANILAAEAMRFQAAWLNQKAGK